MANNAVAVLELMVISFTDADELMDFAATWGVQDSPTLQFRLFQLRNPGDTFVNDQLDAILQTLGGATEQSAKVRKQEEMEELIKALLFDKEIEALGQMCVDGGE